MANKGLEDKSSVFQTQYRLNRFHMPMLKRTWQDLCVTN